MRKVLLIIFALTFTFAYSQDKYELKSQDGAIFCESDLISENTLNTICGKYGVLQFDDSPATPYFFFQIVSSISLKSMYDKEYVVTIETDKNETIAFRAKMVGLTNIIGDNIRMYIGEKSFRNGAKEIAKIFRGNVKYISFKEKSELSDPLGFGFRMKNKETLPQMINSIEKKSGKRFSSDFKRNVGLLAGASSSQSANVNSNVNSNTQNKAKIIVAGHEAVDLGLPSGTKWATCNLGATSPTAAGNAYAWGETSPKSYYTEKNYKYSGHRITTRLSGNTDAAYVNWGKKWRMPTMDDFKELERYCSFVWTGKGFDIIGKNGNKIFLPATGEISGNTNSRRDFCRYWLATNYNSTGYYLFGNRSSTLDYSFGIVPYYGVYIRPVTSDNGF